MKISIFVTVNVFDETAIEHTRTRMQNIMVRLRSFFLAENGRKIKLILYISIAITVKGFYGHTQAIHIFNHCIRRSNWMKNHSTKRIAAICPCCCRNTNFEFPKRLCICKGVIRRFESIAFHTYGPIIAAIIDWFYSASYIFTRRMRHFILYLYREWFLSFVSCKFHWYS